MDCDYGYFTRLNGWQIIKVLGSNETVGDIIRISGPETGVKIKCDRHGEQDGIYMGGEIVGKGFKITCEPGATKEEDQIHYGLRDVTGSWTAEDNGGDPGGGEG